MDVEGTGLELLEAVPDAVVIADVKGRIVFANAQAERMFGYSKLELVGVLLEMLIPARYRKHFPGDELRNRTWRVIVQMPGTGSGGGTQ